MTGEVFTDEDRALYLRVPYPYKDVCKSIPSARWNSDLKAWMYPATASAAQAIAEAFSTGFLTWSTEAQALLERAADMHQAQSHKTALDLPPIPLEKRPAWHHQKQCFWFAYQFMGVMIAADMGTGKSRMGIDLIVNRGHQRVLILCPKSVVQVWPMEFERHAAKLYTVVALDEGSVADKAHDVERASALAGVRKERLVICLNYESAWRDPLGTLLLKTNWDCVLLDESHRIKSPSGKASKFCSRLGDVAQTRLCLTGSPLAHSPLDIYAQYRFLDKSIFGTSFTAFRARYAVMGGYNQHQVLGFQHQEELHQKMYSIAFRVKAEDVQDLPETVDVVRPCTLSPGARKIYTELHEAFVAEVDTGRVTVTNALTKLLRLQQVTSGFIPLDRTIDEPERQQEIRQLDSNKAELLLDILEDLPLTEPVVVFCRFHRDLDAIKEVATAIGRGCAELSGRINELKTWQDDRQGTVPILAAQVQSGSIGVDLTRAHYCVFYSLGFSLSEYLQARKRTHRPGQTERVTYLHLITTQTVDETVYTALDKRQNVVDAILSTVRERHPDQQRRAS